MQAQLDDARKADALVGLVIRPRQFASPLAAGESGDLEESASAAASSSERRLGSSS